MSDESTQGLVCNFGRHKGVLYTRIPVSYLKWMINANHDMADVARAELKRRGTVTPELEITGHAIDRASQRLLGVWKRDREGDEGLHAWLVRKCSEIMERDGRELPDTVISDGVRYVFEMDGVWPVLKSVMKVRGDERS